MAEFGRVKSPPRELNEVAVGSSDHLALLTKRLDNLERKLLGKKTHRDQPPLFQTVRSVQKRLDDCVAGKHETSTRDLWNKVDNLERILHPDFFLNASSSESSRDRAKENLLICYAQQLESDMPTSQVEEIQQLKDYVNSTEFQGLENYEKKLSQVVGRQGEQERELEKLTEDVQGLLKTYYQIMLQLSAQCVVWREELERKK